MPTVTSTCSLLLTGAAVLGAAGAARASDITLIRPSNTGVPGEEVRAMDFDAEGNLWIVGRWPFWGEVGVAMLPKSELPYTPLPGGGFDTGLWTVWSNVDSPIPSPYVHDMEIAPDGVIWLGHDAGLTRFDRSADPEHQWTNWSTANSPMVVDGVRSLDLDAQGHVWLVNGNVTTANGVLFDFDPVANTWTKYEVGVELPWAPPWKSLASVLVGSDGRVWTSNEVLGGLAEFDGAEWVLHPNSPALEDLTEDWDGDVWGTTGASGLWKWNGSDFDTWPLLGGTSTITGVGVGIDGTVYVSTWYGPVFKMIRMIGGTTPEFFVDADGLPRAARQSADGDIWINNYGSTLALGRVRHYTSDGTLLERFNTFNSGLPDYFIDNIQVDSAGNLWFASGEGGLSRFDGARWRNWGNHNDQSEPYPWAGNEPMNSMYEDGQGRIWMGGNGVGLWNPATGEFEAFWNWQNSSLGVDAFIAIQQDGNGDVWIASGDTGVYRLNPETDDWEQHLFGAAFSTANYVQDMVRDLDGNLWVATLTSLHFFNGQTWFGVGSIHGSPVFGPQKLAVHPDGSVWIGAINGLIRYQDGEWTIYDTSNSPMPANAVHGLDIRADGLVGFSVADYSAPTPFPNGVLLFDGTNWSIYTYEDDGLPHYQLGDVEFDANGDLWVSPVSEGVVRIDVPDRTSPADLNRDGVVDGGDLGLLLGAWGACNGAPGCAGDLDGSGAVDGADLGMLLAAWT